MIFAIALVVIDTDGSAFITKAEFDSLKNNFQAQIDNYNSSIDSKIDGAIAAYLAGIQLSKTNDLQIMNGGTNVRLYGSANLPAWATGTNKRGWTNIDGIQWWQIPVPNGSASGGWISGYNDPPVTWTDADFQSATSAISVKSFNAPWAIESKKNYGTYYFLENFATKAYPIVKLSGSGYPFYRIQWGLGINSDDLCRNYYGAYGMHTVANGTKSIHMNGTTYNFNVCAGGNYMNGNSTYSDPGVSGSVTTLRSVVTWDKYFENQHSALALLNYNGTANFIYTGWDDTKGANTQEIKFDQTNIQKFWTQMNSSYKSPGGYYYRVTGTMYVSSTNPVTESHDWKDVYNEFYSINIAI